MGTLHLRLPGLTQHFLVRAFGCGLALVLLGSAAQAASESATALEARGDQLWKDGKLDEAGKSFQAALLGAPRNTALQMKLGGVQLSNNDFVASTETYKDAISRDARNVRAWLGLGFSYLHTGKNSLSMAAFQEAVRLDPSRQTSLKPLLDKLNAP